MWCLCPIPGWDLCACRSVLVLDGCCDMQGVLGVLCNLVVLNLFFFWLTTPMRKWMFTQHERNTKCQICWSIHSTEYGSVYISCVVYTDGISLCVSLIIKKPRCRKSDFPSSVSAQGLLPINPLILSFFSILCPRPHPKSTFSFCSG